jgi:hypothetical protein
LQRIRRRRVVSEMPDSKAPDSKAEPKIDLKADLKSDSDAVTGGQR